MPAPTAARRPPTKWGDREQRRADILDAARERIAKRGYVGLNMRDLAAAAGISPATLYSYFATKEEIFATLYVDAIVAHTETVRPVCESATDVAALLRTLITEYVELYRAYGRHLTLWSAAAPSRGSRALRDAAIAHHRVVGDGLRRAAAAGGVGLLDDDHTVAFLWASVNGVADHLVTARGRLDRFPPAELIETSATRLAAAITAPP